MKNDILKEFRELKIDKNRIGLNCSGSDTIYFCTPIGAEIIGWLGVDGIHFCIIPSLDKNMVFVVSPTPCGQNYTEPIAYNVLDFLRLILSCRDASYLEQISWIDECRFRQLLESEFDVLDGREEVLKKIKETFGIEKMSDPYYYVKTIQKNFDYLSVPYSDEYYDVTGIERH